jgi:site-specific recombinase XerD
LFIKDFDRRHWFATQAISKGIDVPTVAKWLGHKDGGALLMKTYSHLLQEHSQAMAAKLSF